MLSRIYESWSGNDQTLLLGAISQAAKQCHRIIRVSGAWFHKNQRVIWLIYWYLLIEFRCHLRDGVRNHIVAQREAQRKFTWRKIALRVCASTLVACAGRFSNSLQYGTTVAAVSRHRDTFKTLRRLSITTSTPLTPTFYILCLLTTSAAVVVEIIPNLVERCTFALRREGRYLLGFVSPPKTWVLAAVAMEIQTIRYAGSLVSCKLRIVVGLLRMRCPHLGRLCFMQMR